LASQKHSFAGENTVPTTPEAVKFTPDLGQSLEYSPLFHGIHDFPISRIALASVFRPRSHGRNPSIFDT
jgi:hypothetical protein